MWALRYTTDAIAALYLMPRGPAAEVTGAICVLWRMPLPDAARREPTGRPNTYAISWRIMPLCMM
jgi:hypothetical protein